MLLKALRIALGQLIILIDWLTRPRKLKRSNGMALATEGSVVT